MPDFDDFDDDFDGLGRPAGYSAMIGKPRRRRSNGGDKVKLSEDKIALRFAEQHADDLRYVAAWSRWLSWGGRLWRFDDTLAAFDLARLICRQLNTDTSAKTVAAVERLAKSDRRIAATAEQWNVDACYLNTGKDR